MKLSHVSLILFAAALGGAQAQALQGPTPKPPAQPNLPPLQFNHLALGNVARVLSARFKAPVTIVANASAPITGDFSDYGLKQALTAVAQQAGLMVQPMGADDSAGFALIVPGKVAAQAEAPPAAGGNIDIQGELAAANRRREQLLRQRALLLDDAAQLDQ